MTGSTTIVHPLYACAECAGTGPLYHFGRNNGAAVEVAHGCEHMIRDYYPDVPAEWLAEQVIQPGANCCSRPQPCPLRQPHFAS